MHGFVLIVRYDKSSARRILPCSLAETLQPIFVQDVVESRFPQRAKHISPSMAFSAGDDKERKEDRSASVCYPE